jgi:hypothetical protein
MLMATLPPELHPQPVPQPRLWFGLATSVLAWLALGFIDLMIVWQVCGYASEYGVDRVHEYARIASFAISVVLFVIAVYAGLVSYRNFRAISRSRDVINANAADRREFMAMLGVIISVTLGAGIVWLALPPLIVQMCLRAK